MNILFSIIIPTYNRAKEIGRCIDSVRSQIYTNWEAIIVDNYSDDNTEEIVASYNDSRIHYYKNHNHGIISVSRNYGIDRANGDWICFLDSDDSWTPNKLAEVSVYCDEYDFIYHSMKIDAPTKRFYHNGIFKGIHLGNSPFNKLIQNGDVMGTSTVCIRKLTIGTNRFSEEIEYVGLEDYIFWLTIIRVYPDIKVKYIDSPLSFYGVGDNYSVLEKQLKKEKHFIINYKDSLQPELKRDFLRWYMYRKASLYFSQKNYELAHLCLLMSAKSGSSRIRYKSIKTIIHIYIIKFLGIIK